MIRYSDVITAMQSFGRPASHLEIARKLGVSPWRCCNTLSYLQNKGYAGCIKRCKKGPDSGEGSIWSLALSMYDEVKKK